MTNRDHRSYLLVIDTTQNTTESVLKIVDRMPSISNWLKFLPSAVVLVSDLEVQELHAELKQRLPDQRYLLTLLEAGKKKGWLPQRAWEIMNTPAPVS